MASSLGERKRSPQSTSPTSRTSTYDPPSPDVSRPSPGYASQKRLKEESAGAGDQRHRAPTPLVSADDDDGTGFQDHHPRTSASSDPSPDRSGQERGKGGATGACEQPTDKNEVDICIVQHSGQTPTVSNSSPGCVGQKQEDETPSASEQVQHAPSGATEKNEDITITSIRATDVAHTLGRPPAGFYVVLHHNGLEWRTENKPSSVNKDVVEWSVPIPISSDLSAVIHLEVYASFEYEPMLGAGERLRRLTAKIEQLLDRSAKGAPFTFTPKDGEGVSPCTSILVTVKQQKHENCDPLGSRVTGPHWLAPESRGKLEDATDQGHSALARYRKYGEKRDLERSIQRFSRALSFCPRHDPRRAAAKLNLAMAKLVLSQLEGPNSSLEAAFQLHQDALGARPVGHPDRPLTLIHLALVHLARLQRERSSVGEASAKNAERLLREAIEHSATGSYEKQAATVMFQLCAGDKGGRVRSGGQSSTRRESTRSLADEDPLNLSIWLMRRFERFGDLADIHQAITILDGLVRSTSIWGGNRCAALGNLGTAFSYRFERLGQLGDLEDAIATQGEAVHLSPDGHPDKPMYLNNLGLSLHTRFQCRGKLSDLEDAISREREAVRLTPNDHPDKPARLSNLGVSFLGRFERIGQLADLEDAILTQKEAIRLSPDGDPANPVLLDNLGISFHHRFDRLGQLGDLEDAISRKREAVHFTPNDHPDKPRRLSNLGGSFLRRFERLGRLADLGDAILTQKEAIRLSPDGHPTKPVFLNNLGTSFLRRFECLGQLGDIEDAISTQREAVRLTPNDHPDKPLYLSNLGISLHKHLERTGQLGDLEDAVSTLREAVRLSPDGHPDKPNYLTNLGNSFQIRFEHVGQLADLEDAILTQMEAVRLSSDDHPDKPARLNNLGTSFLRRFERLGQLDDLEDAVSTLREAVRLSPDGHPNKPGRLSNLGNSLHGCFERLGQLSDLEDAISTRMEAARLTPDVHPDKPACLDNLGTSFLRRFECLGQLSDLEDATSTYREAVRLSPDGHLNKPGHLNNLGNSFQRRFKLLGQLSDLEDAISRRIDAVCLTPRDHPRKPTFLNNLASSFATRFFHLRQVTDLEHAFSLFSHVASAPIASPRVRLSAAQRWIKCAQLIRHPSLLHAYSVAVSLNPQLAWVGLSLSHRYDELIQSADMVREAAAAALDAGFPETALEWLEQGRSVIWGDLFQLRSSYDELSSAHPDYASRLHALSTQLDHASATHEQSLSALYEQNQDGVDHAPESLRRVADRHRALAIERDKLLQQIRRLPGFERFLLRKPFSQLRAAAHSGPVVILNAAETRCDALIVVAGLDHVIHVPLPNFTSERCANIQVILNRFVRATRVEEGATGKGVSWDDILPPLWKSIVKPVLDALAFSVAPEELSRIFWCPTGPLSFLPIHAAGLYDRQHSTPGHKVFDFVVSSYVPTLAILAPSLNPPPPADDNLRLLAVRQPLSDGQAPLAGVAAELACIKDVVENTFSAQTILVESSVGTIEEVLALMKKTDWVHFACHGVQDGVDSGLCLADRRRLTLRDIVAVSRPRGGLAFLSACQTAMGEKNLSDEAIHIAAGMLFAGYGGVIGTMWSINDDLAPRVARDVYLELLGKGTRPDYREAARALQETIGRLRNQEVPISEWIPFIHVGL